MTFKCINQKLVTKIHVDGNVVNYDAAFTLTEPSAGKITLTNPLGVVEIFEAPIADFVDSGDTALSADLAGLVVALEPLPTGTVVTDSELASFTLASCILGETYVFMDDAKTIVKSRKVFTGTELVATTQGTKEMDNALSSAEKVIENGDIVMASAALGANTVSLTVDPDTNFFTVYDKYSQLTGTLSIVCPSSAGDKTLDVKVKGDYFHLYRKPDNSNWVLHDVRRNTHEDLLTDISTDDLGVDLSMSGDVANFSALPDAAIYSDKYFLVRAAQGIWLTDSRKPKGVYRSDGTNWDWMGTETAQASGTDLTTATGTTPKRWSPFNAATLTKNIIKDTTDFYHNGSVKLQTTTAGATVAGHLATDTLNVGDWKTLAFAGANSSNWYVLRSPLGFDTILSDSAGGTSFRCLNNEKLAITEDGINVTGAINGRDIVADGEKIDKMGDWYFYTPDNSSYFRFLSPNGKASLYGADGGGTYLYYNGVTKFNTHSAGAKVTGSLQVSSAIDTGSHIELGGRLRSKHNTNDYLAFFSSADFPIGLCVSNSFKQIWNTGGSKITGNLEVTKEAKLDGIPISRGLENRTSDTCLSIGTGSLGSLTSADYCVALGDNALNKVTGNGYSTAVGYNVLSKATAHSNNGFGVYTLQNVTNGRYNCGFGRSALSGCTEGEYNSAYGSYALAQVDNTDHNTAIGYRAGAACKGAFNTIIGSETFDANTTGSYNTIVGSTASGKSTDVEKSTIIGYAAGLNISTGDKNTFVGHYAGNTTTTGYNNICIGEDAETTGTANANQCTLGNSFISNLRCNDNTISTLSDARDKTSVTDCEYGLDYINALRPVTFTWDYRKEHEKNGKMPTRHGERSVGFIAQELKEVQDANDAAELNTYQHYPIELNEDGSPMDGTLGVDLIEADYGKLLPVAIQAIKDLSAKVDELEERLAKKR